METKTKKSSKRKPKERLEHIGEALNKAFRNNRLDLSWETVRLQKFWLEAGGEIIYAHSRPKRVINDVLHVKVDNSSWLYQLEMLRGELISNFSSLRGAPPIAEIKLSLGEIPSNEVSHKKLEMAPLTAKEKRFVEETLASLPIEDADFKKTVKSVLTKGIIRRRLLERDKNR